METCPLDCEANLGNCKFCIQKEDCILLAILHKVEYLETMIKELTPASKYSAISSD